MEEQLIAFNNDIDKYTVGSSISVAPNAFNTFVYYLCSA